MNLADNRILVTGGAGFLGSHLIDKLQKIGCNKIITPRFEEYDLRDKDQIKKLYNKTKPEVIIHLAASVGGIGANLTNPGKFLYDNIIMGFELMEQARQFKVEKFVNIGSVCSYPKFTKVPFKEDDLWLGYPEETNAPYGLAKKMLMMQSQAYREQYNFNSVFPILVNLYGPNDNFDLASSHVIPAIILKCLLGVKNNQNEIKLWGSGEASREFLYVKDAVDAIILATQHLETSQPVNIGTGKEIKIKDLATLIQQLVGYKGKIVWDKTKPDGQPRRCLDVTRAKELLNFTAKTNFETGLQETISWVKNNLKF